MNSVPVRPTLDVLVCGLGPVGQLLALLLGGLGVRTLAVDAAPAPYGLPRAAVVDDEVLRIFQSAGIDRRVLADAQVHDAVTFLTASGRAVRVLAPRDGGLGQPPLASIHQPTLESTMLEALAERDRVTVLWGHEVAVAAQDADGVTARVRRVGGGADETVRARYLVGCDGASSPVREGLGIAFGGSTFVQRWLVVDALVDRPVGRVPHPHFVGAPGRPAVTLPMSPGRHRWEWMLHPEESPSTFLVRDRIDRLLAAWLSGERAEIERAVVYTYHARTATRWRIGRVLLAGDAAHVMPPFVGQGFASGARDVANLAWKLDAVLHGAPPALLDTYESERRPHVLGMQRFAVRWGGVVQTTDRRVAAVRDATLRLLDRTGALGVIGDRAKPLPTLAAGAFAERPARLPWRRAVGVLFPQPDRLDDRLGPGWAAVTRDAVSAERWRTYGVRAVVRRGDGWLERRGADWALLRPDRYVFACGAEEAEWERAVRALRAAVGSSLREG